jgi:Right handed beta helix region
MLQNMYVVQDGATYTALTDLTREVLHSSPSAGAAIQSAIDALAGSGGVVTIGRGTFRVAEPIRLASQVCLRGSGRSSRLLVDAANEAGIGLLGLGVSGVVVADLAVVAEPQRTVAGIVLDACGDCKLHGLFCADFGSYGIWLRNSSFLCEISGCSLAGNRRANLYLDTLRAGQYGNFMPNLVTNCVIYGGGKGIECHRAIALNIVACTVHQTHGSAYHIHSRSHSVAISGARSYQISGDAVLVEDSHEFSLTGSVLCWHTGHGVAVRDACWGAIAGNQISDSGSYNPGGPDRTLTFAALPPDLPLHNGIDLRNVKGCQISSNTIFNWSAAPPLGCGVCEDDRSFKNSIVGNSVNFYADAAVRSAGQHSIARDNIAHAEQPYNDLQTAIDAQRKVQSFDPALTERFIAIQTRRDEQ